MSQDTKADATLADATLAGSHHKAGPLELRALASNGARSLPLIDSFGRVHRSLRISVTDRCNIRCQYCMPEVAQFMNSQRLLSFAEIAAFVQVVATLGIRKLRITGGEPLMRSDLSSLIEMLNSVAGIEDIALTTNGMLLAGQIQDLARAGLKRVNISLDTLSESTFQRLSRRDGLDQVLGGIDAALQQPGIKVRLNALVMRDINFEDVLELVGYARQKQVPLRFIEFMPLDAERVWSREQLVTGQEMRQKIESKFGPLVRVATSDPAQPSTDYTFADGLGSVGFIDSVSRPFCGNCDRLRLTADGKLRNCLFSREEWDVRDWLREGSHEKLVETLRECLAAKRAQHGIDDHNFEPPQRAMFQIGG